VTGDEQGLADKGRLLFGAGFAFGVACALLILVVVVATVTGETARELLGRDVFVTIAAGICFAGVVGVGLYVLAFPENRLEVPVGRALQAEIAARETDGEGTAGGSNAATAPTSEDDAANGDGTDAGGEPKQ